MFKQYKKMNILKQKIELSKAVLETDNSALLKHIEALLEVYQTDLFDELSDYQKLCVSQARQQLKNGEGIPHKQVMKKYKRWLTK